MCDHGKCWSVVEAGDIVKQLHDIMTLFENSPLINDIK